MRMNKIPEKPRLLGILKDAGFDVPDSFFFFAAFFLAMKDLLIRVNNGNAFAFRVCVYIKTHLFA